MSYAIAKLKRALVYFDILQEAGIYDLQGKLIEKTIKTGLSEGDNAINYTPNIPINGVYMLKIITNENVYIQKLMKN